MSQIVLKVNNTDFTHRLNTKQNNVIDNSLEIRHVRFLQDFLDAKQSLLSDVDGVGVSLIYGTKLRRKYGSDGIDITIYLNMGDVNDPEHFNEKSKWANIKNSD